MSCHARKKGFSGAHGPLFEHQNRRYRGMSTRLAASRRRRRRRRSSSNSAYFLYTVHFTGDILHSTLPFPSPCGLNSLPMSARFLPSTCPLSLFLCPSARRRRLSTGQTWLLCPARVNPTVPNLLFSWRPANTNTQLSQNHTRCSSNRPMKPCFLEPMSNGVLCDTHHIHCCLPPFGHLSVDHTARHV